MTARSGMQGLDVLTCSTPRALTDWERRRGGVWAAAEVRKAMPDATPGEQHQAVKELLAYLGLREEPPTDTAKETHSA